MMSSSRNHAGYSARGAARTKKATNAIVVVVDARGTHAFSTTVCDDDDDDDVDAPSSATASPTIGGRTRGDDSSRRMPDTNRHFYIDICHFILCNRMYTTYTTRAHC